MTPIIGVVFCQYDIMTYILYIFSKSQFKEQKHSKKTTLIKETYPQFKAKIV